MRERTRRNNRPAALLARAGWPQLVANAGAEVGAADPASWFHLPAGTEWANQGHNGVRSLRLNVAGAMADWRTALYPVTGGRRYRVGLWVKGTGTPQMVLAARWFSDAGGANYLTEQWLILGGTFANWTRKGHIVQAPVGALAGDLMFRAAFNTTADLYGDDFFVQRFD